MAIVEVSMIPVGTESTSMSEYLARAISTIKHEPGLKYQITATGTILEGSLQDCLNAVTKMHEAVFDAHVHRLITNMEIDDRRDKKETIEEVVESITRKV